MPASIQLSQLEIQWILNLVEKKFNISVLDSYSCQKLSDVLLDEKVFISYNTIRRLFGIISPKFQTSRYTLNLLLKELGFDDFVEFQTFIKKYKTESPIRV
jgi:DNA-binding MurR/RpiR family transcriptional regulator